MSAFPRGQVAVRYITRLVGNALNILILLSLLLTSCGPVKSESGTSGDNSLSTQEPNIVQPNNYQSPVFTRPEPRTGADLSPGDQTVPPAASTGNIDTTSGVDDDLLMLIENGQFDPQAYFQVRYSDAVPVLTDDELWFKSFVPAPNPVRTESPTFRPEPGSGDGANSGNQPVSSPPSIQITGNHGRAEFPKLPGTGRTFTVTTLADTDDGTCDSDCSLREAIYAANDSPGADIITFGVSGVILLDITLPYILDAAGLTIDGTGQTVTVSGGNFGQIFYVDSGVPLMLDRLTIYGGAYNEGTLTITDSTFTGGDVWSAGMMNITDSTFASGYIYSAGTLSITDSTFSGNGDRIIYNENMLTIQNSTFTDGGVFNDNEMTLTNSNFTGGIVFNDNVLTITDSTFSDNSGDYAGGVFNMGMLTITNSTFSGNTATDNGGGVFNDGTLTIIDSTFSGNSAINGGGVFNNGMLTIIDSIFSGNNAESGGGVSNNGALTITNSTFSDNSANYGGGINNFSPLTITDSTFSGNIATGFGGGGVLNWDTLTITDSTFSGNSADVYGGGALNWDTLTITNSTFSGNRATDGGGIFNYPRGAYNNANLYLYNTLLANSASGGDCAGEAVTAGSNNLIEASGLNACGLTNGVNDNIVGSHPNLGTLTGSPAYYELDANSPAIDSGDNTICTVKPVSKTSQNGVTRPQGGQCDIGAYELPAPVVDEHATISSSCVQDGSTATYGCTQGKAGGPINTRTGGYEYSVDDISIPTSAGALTFTRDYASPGIGQPTTLSPGWTHNQDTRLIMPDDPGGEAGTILLKLHSANLFTFDEQGNDTYLAAPGLIASLVREPGLPARFVVTDASQNSYIFDEDGQLLAYADAQGHTWEYSYDSAGRLVEVSADDGSSTLSFAYDSQGRLTSVADQTRRNVTYSYDSNGDLVSVTDVLGQDWTYTYDSGHRLTAVLDPDGKTLERTEYNEQGRAVRQYDGSGNLVVELAYNPDGTTSMTDALGNSSLHTYDERGTLVSQTDPSGGETGKVYFTNFRPFSITDAGGRTTDLKWSADGADLTRVVDAAGSRTDITYDALNNPTAVVDPLGYLTTYEYDGTNLTAATDALGGETTYAYTSDGFLDSATDALGQTTTFTYDEHGQRTSMTDSLGNTWHYTNDDLGRIVDTTDPLGRFTHNEFDPAGRLVRLTRNYDPDRPRNDENQYNLVTEYEYDARGNQAALTDTYGRTTHYEYDDAGRLIQTIDPAGSTTTNTYDITGQLIATTDPLGRTTHYTYDAAGRLVSVTDPLGDQTHTAYNPDGSLASTTDALGRITSYQYDELGRAAAVTYPDGGVTRTAYDANGSVVSTTDALGNTTTYEYDALSRQIRQTDPLGGVTETFYDALGRRVQTVDPLGYATTYTYDDAGRMTAVTDAGGAVTRYEYDTLGRRMAVVDANGSRTAYTYDALDRVTVVTDPLGNSTTTAFDALGNVLSRTDANGNAIAYEYDAQYRLTGQTDPLDGVTAYTYDAAGNRTAVTDADGHTVTTVYDALNRPLSVTGPDGAVTTTVYDAAGNVASTTDELGNTTTFTYDALNRQVAVTDALGDVTRYQYDNVGNRTDLIDANGVVTHYEYDPLGRLAAVVENYRPAFEPTAEINVRTEYTYDEDGNRSAILDANGHTTTFAYDELGRLVQETDPLGNTWQYGYDAAGNRTAVLDANGATTQYTYDAAGRLTGIDHPEPDADVSFTYDAAGRRTAMSDGLGTTAWTYDELNRPTAITDPYGKTVGYAYDAVGNRTALTYPPSGDFPDGKSVTYTYDPADRMSGVTDWNWRAVSYAYDAGGRLVSAALPNGVHSAYSYDALGQVLQIQHTLDSSLLAYYQYAYDAAGNRTQAVETLLGKKGTGPTVQVTVTDSGGAPLAGRTVYAFSNGVYTGYNKITDASGQASITLPEGSYRFRTDVDPQQPGTGGTQFWSGATDHCTIGNCSSAIITVPPPVLVSVQDTDGTPKAGLAVYAFNGTTYTGYHGTTDAGGQVSLRLPEGEYRFRADFNGTQFWSGETDACAVPGCSLVSVQVTLPVTVRVVDSLEMPKSGVKVYAFSGTTYTGYNGTTDADGQVTLTLPEGDYRFRADYNSTQFWSGETDHCTVPGCSSVQMTVSLPLTVTVQDTDSAPKAGVKVYAFDGTTYTNYSGTTDTSGQAQFTLPPGSYRFRADYNGSQFWSGAQNHCTVPGCASASITVTRSVLVSVQDTDGAPKSGLKVYAFTLTGTGTGTTYTGYNGITNADGQAVFTLPQGSYRFRADYNGTQFWSGAQNHCSVPGCDSAAVTVTKPLIATVQDTDGTPKSGLKVYAFDGTTYTGYNGTTNADGQVMFTLPQGSYRFRADLNSTQFWSGTQNHCTLPGCTSAVVTVTRPLTVTVQDAGGAPKSGVKVYAFTGTTYTGYNGASNASGQVTLTLPQGGYRFRADYNGVQYWSGSQNHCSLPGCENASVVVGPQATTTSSPTGTMTPTLTPTPTSTPTPTGTPTPTDTPTSTDTSTPTGTPTPTDTLTPTSTDTAEPTVIGAVPGQRRMALNGVQPISLVVSAPRLQTNGVTVTVQDTDAAPKAGLKVYAFTDTTYTGYNGTTDANGQVTLILPEGNYRFRADMNSTQFWSDDANHCTVPSCTSVAITVTVPLMVTVQDTDGEPKSGLKVYAFDDTVYTGFNSTTDANGQVTLTLLQGSYRFRADMNPQQSGTGGTQFWSGDANHCDLPGCTSAAITVTAPLMVTVQDTYGTPKAGLSVYAFDATTYTGYSGTTDADGQMTFTLPPGSYRFRADYNGTQFWSGDANHCALPGCGNASVIVTIPLVVTVASQAGYAYGGVPVYVFDGDTYTGYHGGTDDAGHVMLTLPQGSYRFRADYDSVQFWSAEQNECTLPGCSAVSVYISGGYSETTTTTIDYTYDPLYRLTAADYSDDRFFHYTYDPVGNRLAQETQDGTKTYVFDDANRLSSADGVPYTWDANGNLLSDGENTYTYDSANRLVGFGGQDAYGYNGLGDRLSYYSTNYTLDLAGGLPQVLNEGNDTQTTDTYLYGLGRLADDYGYSEYYLTDALGSVRQVIDEEGLITLTHTYAPYGEVIDHTGYGYSNFGFTGEMTDDNTGLVYLRARYYSPYLNQFIQPDTIVPDLTNPGDWNRYTYAWDNPINYTDPSGYKSEPPCSIENYRYCILKGEYEGAFIDLQHWQPAKIIAQNIDSAIRRFVGKSYKILSLNDPGFLKGYGKILTERSYLMNIPSETPIDNIWSIELGIFMDFEWHIEGLENVVPSCYSSIGGPVPRCSAFSNEDLPSDYLGFIANKLGWNTINDVIGALKVDGYGSNDMPAKNAGTWRDAFLCNFKGKCGTDNPYNKCFTSFKVPSTDDKFVSKPLPSELLLKPIGPGKYWRLIW